MIILDQIAKNKNIKKPVIFGFSSLELTNQEKSFFKKSGPIGFILFKRNIENKNQVKKLTDSLKNLMGGEILILIDQEGGRVQRLKGTDFPDYPAAKKFADLYKTDPQKAKNEAYKNYCQLAKDLKELGINTNCAPLLDILTPETHDIIGDRAFASNSEQVTDLAKITCQAFLENQILPVIKHIPGHGRATSDSHLELPIVDATLEELEKTDFTPFRELSDMKLAMSAHILYKKIDAKLPATISQKVIKIIRENIGFKNILMSDDISMKALSDDIGKNSKLALKAGCDLILHCNGKMDEMKKIAKNLPKTSDYLMNKFLQND